MAPKRYIPPFLAGEEENKGPRINEIDELDRLYELEIEGVDPKEAKRMDLEEQKRAEDQVKGG